MREERSAILLSISIHMKKIKAIYCKITRSNDYNCYYMYS